MKKAIRFLFPVAALLAIFAFAACDSEGGSDPVDPCDGVECNEGETCVDGECVGEVDPCEGVTCEAGEVCVDGECIHNLCDGVTCGDCETCDPATGECATTCAEGEVCEGGVCVDESGPCAGVTCDACEECDEETGDCVTTCAEGEICYMDACCAPSCGGAECGMDGCGGSCGTCEATEFCNASMMCEEIPTITCQHADAAYCDATIVNELVIANAPDAAAGEPGCCCDYDGDGVFDNAVANLIANVGSMADLSLEDLNVMVAEQLTEGTIIVLFEMIGLTGMDATDYFNMHFFLGEDTDGDATNNFAGDAEFTVMAESLDTNGDPLIKFEGAMLDADGMVTAPGADGQYGQFIIPVDVPDYNINLQLVVDGVRIAADLSQTDGMYEMANGNLCGYITAEQIFGALNQFEGGNCDCLNVDGDLVIFNDDGTFTCNTPTAAPTCDPSDPDTGDMQEICNYLTQYCSTALSLIPMFLDVDTDGDPSTGEGISLGATFTATSAVIVEGTVE